MDGPRRFLTIPWIVKKGDHLTALIERPGEIDFAPVRLHDTRSDRQRHAVTRLAHNDPDAFAAAFEMRMIDVGGFVHGLLLTHDWPAAMRIATQVAHAHGLKVALAPHEAFFVLKDQYYKDVHTGQNMPQADLVFAWGNLQKEIFVERGFPRERVMVVGSPKLASYRDAKAKLGRAAFRRAIGAPEDKPLLVFAAQHLDNLSDSKDDRDAARDRQLAMVETLAALAERRGWTLLLRIPPGSGPNIIAERIARRWGARPPFLTMTGDAPGAHGDAVTNMLHADLVVAYASTMLLEASLLGKPALVFNDGLPTSMVESHLGLPVARNAAELEAEAAAWIGAPSASISDKGLAWARWAFSDGDLTDVDASDRIRQALRGFRDPIFLGNRARLFSARGRPPRRASDPLARWLRRARLVDFVKDAVWRRPLGGRAKGGGAPRDR